MRRLILSGLAAGLLAMISSTGSFAASDSWAMQGTMWADHVSSSKKKPYAYKPFVFKKNSKASAKKKYSGNKKGAAKWKGGAKPYIAAVKPPVVAFRSKYGKGSIVIDTKGRKLYYVLSSTKAYRYPIAVGRKGFTWSGTHKISKKVNWPSWRPPAEMRQRQPGLPKVMSGGINNPLGAKALYLGSTLYRIHGTNKVKSVGRAVSSGCFRMKNGHVAHLAKIAGVGTKVRVLKRLPKKVRTASEG